MNKEKQNLYNFAKNGATSTNNTITIIEPNPQDELLSGRIRRNNKVLSAIREHGRITKYQLVKVLKIPYSSISRSVQDLLYAGVIASALIIGDKHQTQRLLFIPSEVEK